NLADLGRYYCDYVGVMAHFDEVLPGRVARVSYEDLVEDVEGVARRLLAAIGLPFDAECLRFDRNSRPVFTPSAQQVRRPINSDGMTFWQHYRPWLGPLEKELSALDRP